MGHEAWYMGIGDFAYEPDGSLSTKARAGHAKTYRSLERHLADIKTPDVEQLIGMDEFDVVMLRNDPADDAESDPWRNNAGVAFGQLIASSGVLVVNDPTSLANALSKAYFQHFPEIVRPRTLISRDEDMIEEFITELGGKAVLKPLQGSGGAGVFLIDRKEAPNLKQMIEAISRDGYVVAQEYLPEAAKGDVRLFVMNGQPLMVDGKYAAFRRTPSTKDIRSNMSRRRQGREGQGHRRDARDGRGRAAQAGRRRHVPRRPRHRRRQADGDQRLQPRRPRQRAGPLGGQLRARGHRRARAQGQHPPALPGDRQHELATS